MTPLCHQSCAQRANGVTITHVTQCRAPSNLALIAALMPPPTRRTACKWRDHFAPLSLPSCHPVPVRTSLVRPRTLGAAPRERRSLAACAGAIRMLKRGERGWTCPCLLATLFPQEPWGGSTRKAFTCMPARGRVRQRGSRGRVHRDIHRCPQPPFPQGTCITYIKMHARARACVHAPVMVWPPGTPQKLLKWRPLPSPPPKRVSTPHAPRQHAAVPI